VDVSKLARSWFHSHEEDKGDRIVYRSDAFDFPRSRAPRDSLVLEPDGTAAVGHAGPADKTISTLGTWDVSGDVLRVATSGVPVEWEIEVLDDDALTLRRLPKGERGT
jgi:hypothetical protein